MDYSRYLYKPFDPNTLSALEAFDEVFRFKIRNKAKVIDYMILMYDHNNTELRQLYPDYYTRKRYAAVQAGFVTGKGGKLESDIEAILVGENDEFNAALIRYLLMQGIPDYPSLVALREMQARDLEDSFRPTEAKDRKQIRENLEKITSDIARLEERIFTGVETENVRKALYQYMENERVRLRPEYMAEVIKAGKVKEVIG